MKINNTISDVLLDDIFKAKVALLQPDSQKSKGRCLSDQDIASLIDNRLDSEAYDRMLEHIDSCDSCYMRWVDAFSFTQEKLPENPMIRKYYKDFIGAVVSLAAVIILFLYPFHNTSDPLQNSFKIALNNNITYENLTLNTKPSIENQIKKYITAFQNTTNNYQKVSYEQKAFATGLYTALQPLHEAEKQIKYPDFIDSNLINNINQNDSSLSIIYHIGRWCLLIKALVDSNIEIPAELWEEQYVFINNMSDRIKKDDNILTGDKDIILRGFKTINDRLLNNIQQDFSNIERRSIISKEIEKFIVFVLTELN